MQIVRKDIDSLNVTISLTIEKSDYSQKFESELKKHKNQAQLKGFRKGMTPISVIKKMYGKAILSDVVNETLQTKLFEYLDEQNLNYLGQPLPNRESDHIHLNPNDLQDHTFTFDLGLAPTLDIKGVSANDSYDYMDVQISDKSVDEEITAARRRFGKRIEAEDTIQNMDMIKVDADELDGEAVKEGGWKTDFSILVDIIKDEKVKADLLTKKVGDTFTFNINKIEDKEQSYTDKYLLKKPEDSDQEIGEMFVGTITEVSRVEPAALDNEFFSTFGDESVIDEETLKTFFRKDLKAYYDNQAMQLMYRDIMDAMMEQNDITLPETFLKRYLKETNENVSDEVLENEFDAFAKNMKWSLQKSHLAKEYDIKVEEQDLRQHFTNQVFSYMRNYGNMDYNFITQTVDRIMKDKDQVNKAYEEIMADRLFVKIGETVQKKSQTISQDDFIEKVKAINEKVNNL